MAVTPVCTQGTSGRIQTLLRKGFRWTEHLVSSILFFYFTSFVILKLSSESVRETWESLPRNANGDILKDTGDYQEHQGICRKPITIRDTLSFSITHKVYYHVLIFYIREIMGFPKFTLFEPRLLNLETMGSNLEAKFSNQSLILRSNSVTAI